MINWVRTNHPKHVFMVTECSMSDNVAAEEPEVDFIRPCNLCPYMKMITLPKILACLETLEPKVEIPEDVARRARVSVERMIAVG
jgi:quinolinate synthase